MSQHKNTEKKIFDFLEKHNYQVFVFTNKKSPKKIFASFPERKMNPRCSSFTVSYEIDGLVKDIAKIKVVVSSIDEEMIECPKYALKEIVFCDIYKMCEIINYSTGFIRFSIDKKEVGEEDFKKSCFSIRLNKKEKQKEQALSEIVLESRTNGFSKSLRDFAVIEDVQDSYEMIENICSIGDDEGLYVE